MHPQHTWCDYNLSHLAFSKINAQQEDLPRFIRITTWRASSYYSEENRPKWSSVFRQDEGLYLQKYIYPSSSYKELSRRTEEQNKWLAIDSSRSEFQTMIVMVNKMFLSCWKLWSQMQRCGVTDIQYYTCILFL